MDYQEAIEEIRSRKTGKDDITLEPVLNALEELERPDKDYEVILVGGTNGKGSTVEMTSEMLQSLGKDVGISKSPHLTSARERIKLNGEKISEEEFLELYREVEKTDQELSFFECMVVIAYLYFSKKKVDYSVMEVGMGGRFDATNAADPELSVITNVQRDHQEFLGESREERGREKAEIAPENGKVVTRTELNSVKEKVKESGSEIIKPAKIEEKGDGKYFFQGQKFRIPVNGSFQRENLENALKAVKEVESVPENIESSLKDLECPGRMETITNGSEIILDGAHNADALKTVLNDFPDDFICVFNALETKNVEEMIEVIENSASEFIFTESDVKWSTEAEKLQKISSTNSKAVKDPEKALKVALDRDKPVVVTGSLYLIGAVKQTAENIKL